MARWVDVVNSRPGPPDSFRESGRQRPLILISVCRNNPEELRATLTSVALQSVSPARHLVIDGSDSGKAPEIAQLAETFGAEYSWKEPRGIYDAMRRGLDLIEDDAWVWFLNATDVLAGREAIRRAREILDTESEENETVWAVGRTAVELPTPHLLPFPSPPREWAQALREGEIGLPHPSTIVRLSALRDVDSFTGPYRISKDYEMGLRLIRRFGPPALIHSPLSVYDQSGESARRANENVLHKAEARTKNQTWWKTVREPTRMWRAARREWLRRRYTKTHDPSIWTRLKWDEAVIPSGEHFCREAEGPWPSCCVRYLRNPRPS